MDRLRSAETAPLDADGKVALFIVLGDARAEITRLREERRRLRRPLYPLVLLRTQKDSKMKDANLNVLWVCQWEGEGGSSIHDTPEEAREYGSNRGDDEPFVVFPIRLQRWVSVVESLPPDGVQVLARSVTGRQFQCAHCKTTGGWRDYDGSVWAPKHVTHWMPTLVEPVEWAVEDGE